MPIKKPEIRLFDFQVLNKKDNDLNDSDDEKNFKDETKFLIKMYGMNEKGKTYCIYVKNFEPFFYVLVPDNWSQGNVLRFKTWLTMSMGSKFENSLTFCKLRKGKKAIWF